MSNIFFYVIWPLLILTGLLIPTGKDERQRMLRYQIGNITLVFLFIGIVVYSYIYLNDTHFIEPLQWIVFISIILGTVVAWIYQKAKKLR